MSMGNCDEANEIARHDPLLVPSITRGTYLCVLGFVAYFAVLIYIMGLKNVFGTMMATSFDLLLNTVFFIMAVAMIAGAIANIMSEFGVIALINNILSPLMKPLYRLPGASALGAVTTFLSDNPAIAVLAKDRDFIKYFTYVQRALLTNFGTSFGMGLIVVTVMLSQATSDAMVYAVGVGLAATIFGSMISVAIMRVFVKRYYGDKGDELIHVDDTAADGTHYDTMKFRKIRPGNSAQRTLSALLDGGKAGVELGFIIAPGIVCICTVVMMLVFGQPEGGYTGKAYEGIGLVPFLAAKIDFILNPMFGFSSLEAIIFPCMAIGSTGAAVGLVPGMLAKGLIGANDIAVFTAIGMTWSGYLTTHVAMLDAMDCRELIGKAIFSHTIAGICAGVIAHWLFVAIVG